MSENDNSITYLRFPQKLWYLLTSPSDAIKWGNSGKTILINHLVLDSYLRCDQSIFKTTHISSFIRQLNLYGFRKVSSHLLDPLCNASNPYLHEYIHDEFQLGKHQLLQNIKRKSWNLKKNKSSKIISNRLQKSRQLLQIALKNAAQQCKISLNISTSEVLQEHKFPSRFPTDTFLQKPSNISTYIQNFRASTGSSEDNVDADAVDECQDIDYSAQQEVNEIENSNTSKEYVIIVEALPNTNNHNEDNCEIITDKIYTVNPEYEPPNYIEYMSNFQNKIMDEEHGNGDKNISMENVWENTELLEEFETKDILYENSNELKELYTQISQSIEILNA